MTHPAERVAERGPAAEQDPAEQDPAEADPAADQDPAAGQDPAEGRPPQHHARALAVVDVDGVVADVRHRLRYLERQPKDWGGFFRAAAEDPPLEVGLETVRRLAEVYEIVYLSGRPERLRRDTLAWFRTHGLPAGELHLRRVGDFRPSAVVKVETLRRLAARAPVAVVVDDDPTVLAAVRQAGFDVLPATWMGQPAVLQEAQEQEGRT